MKTVANIHHIELDGIDRGQQCAIQQSPKAFEILSSNLYTDPIRAIVRELTANAYDAHVESSIEDQPVVIHLPTLVDDTFYVEDFGSGLSEEQIKTIYTTYFASTKTDTNELIGAFGLGSKTPFAYTDQYFVTSSYDGVKTTYMMYKDEVGVPRITVIDKVPTETTGIKVSFTVKKQDFDQFEQHALDIARWFPTQPVVIADDHQLDIPQHQYIKILDDRSGFERNPYYNTQRSFFALVGNILYRINDIDVIRSRIDRFGALPRMKIIVAFNIGEIDLSANREHVYQNERTNRKIIDKINKIIDRMVEIVTSGITNEYVIDDLNTIVHNAEELFEPLNRSHYGREFVKRVAEYDQTIGELFSRARKISAKDVSDKFKVVRYTRSSSRGKNFRRSAVFNGPITDNFLSGPLALASGKFVVFNSTANVGALANLDYSTGVVFALVPKSKTVSEQDIAYAAEKLSIRRQSIILTSDLHRPREAKQRITVIQFSHTDYVNRYNEKYNGYNVPRWNDVSDPTNLKGIFVNVKLTDIVDDNGNVIKEFYYYGQTVERMLSQIVEIVNAIHRTNFTVQDVYGIRSRNRNKIINDESNNLIDGFAAVRQFYEQHKRTIDDVADAVNVIDDNVYRMIVKNFDALSNSKTFHKLANVLHGVQPMIDDNGEIRRVIDIIQAVVHPTDDEKKFTDALNEIKQRYPLIATIANYVNLGNKQTIDAINDYINVIDQVKE